MDWYRLVFLLALGLASCSGPDQSGSVEINTEDAPVDGALLYLNNCASCHGADGGLGVSGAKDLRQTKMNSEQIQQIIRNGKGDMPPFEQLLSTDKEVEAVQQHVSSLGNE